MVVNINFPKLKRGGKKSRLKLGKITSYTNKITKRAMCTKTKCSTVTVRKEYSNVTFRVGLESPSGRKIPVEIFPSSVSRFLFRTMRIFIHEFIFTYDILRSILFFGYTLKEIYFTTLQALD